MNLPKSFDEYVGQGIIRKCSANRPRSDFLAEESGKSLKGLNKRLDIMGIDTDNANSIIKDCYDIVMEMVRSNLLLAGYCSAGQFAHEAEVSYLRKLGFPDNDVSFLNDLRYFRNSVTYYGKLLGVEYAKNVVKFTRKIYPELSAIRQKINTEKR